MGIFKIEAEQFLRGETTQFTGEFMVEDRGEIAGYVRAPDSSIPIQPIFGRLISWENGTGFEFIRRPLGDQILSPIEYQVVRPYLDGPEQYNFDGEYKGSHRPVQAGRTGYDYVDEGSHVNLWIPHHEKERRVTIVVSTVRRDLRHTFMTPDSADRSRYGGA